MGSLLTTDQRICGLSNSGASLESFEEQFFRTILFKTFNLDSTWQLLTRGLGGEPRLNNCDLERYCSILSTSTTTIYSKAYYGAYPQYDSEWQSVGLVREPAAEKFHFRVVQMMIERRIPAEAAAAKSLDKIADLLVRLLPTDRRF